ncbi:type I-F CRISPR-associated protein Csy1 [Vibrio crassostreae]|uniref:type I-F CRISPR-associated protein Csy1 n=1 Tax=Vibrio crassostreae TaxID=246167 RepID=UPI001B30447F|nr:type I-F CRISPR-associated protein Csy1 [Vibrio crassostreae]
MNTLEKNIVECFIEKGLTGKGVALFRENIGKPNWAEAVNDFIDKQLAKAHHLQTGTHYSKLMNPDSSAACVNAFSIATNSRDDFVCTQSIGTTDAFGSAGYAKCGKLLLVENEHGETLYQLTKNGDRSCLRMFAKDAAQLKKWVSQIESAYNDKPFLDSYVPQLHFPISEKEYHLIHPLRSTPLYDALFNAISERYSRTPLEEGAKKRVFPNMAKIGIGGDNPINMSNLLGKISGTVYMLNCEPPAYHPNKAPTGGTLITSDFKRSVYPITKALTEHLSSEHKDSRKNRTAINKRFLSKIAKAFLNKVSDYRVELGKEWAESEECNLNEHHKALIIHREVSNLYGKELAKPLSEDLADWLAETLNSQQITLSDDQHHHIQRFFEQCFLVRFKNTRGLSQ